MTSRDFDHCERRNVVIRLDLTPSAVRLHCYIQGDGGNNKRAAAVSGGSREQGLARFRIHDERFRGEDLYVYAPARRGAGVRRDLPPIRGSRNVILLQTTRVRALRGWKERLGTYIQVFYARARELCTYIQRPLRTGAVTRITVLFFSSSLGVVAGCREAARGRRRNRGRPPIVPGSVVCLIFISTFGTTRGDERRRALRLLVRRFRRARKRSD